MKMLYALGLLVGGFLLVPKGVLALAAVFVTAKFSPVLGIGLLALSLFFGGLR